MKYKFNGIEVESTPEEFAKLIQMARLGIDKVEETTPEQPEEKPLLKRASEQEIKQIDATQSIHKPILTPPQEDPKVAEYIRALYTYRPNRHSRLGRGPFVVQLLATGESYTIKKLVALSNSNPAQVVAAIRRAISGGCVIEPNVNVYRINTRVRMTSLGTVEQARYARDFAIYEGNERRNRV